MTVSWLKMLLGLLLFMSVCAPNQAGAQGGPGYFWFGNDLYAACTSGNEAQLHTCTGYIMAIVDVLAQSRNEGTPARACVPFNIAQQQVLDITVNYLRANPELRRRQASTLVFLALSARYPCP